MIYHDLSEQISLFQAFLRDQICIMVRTFSDKIKMAAHVLTSILKVYDALTVVQLAISYLNGVNLLIERNDGEVDCATSCMSWLSRNVSSWNELLFRQEGIEERLSFVLFWSLYESHEVIDSFLGTICIINQQRVAIIIEFFLNVR